MLKYTLNINRNVNFCFFICESSSVRWKWKSRIRSEFYFWWRFFFVLFSESDSFEFKVSPTQWRSVWWLHICLLFEYRSLKTSPSCCEFSILPLIWLHYYRFKKNRFAKHFPNNAKYYVARNLSVNLFILVITPSVAIVAWWFHATLSLRIQFHP